MKAEYEGGEPDPDQFMFKAGSYSAYNTWREHLCRMAHGIRPQDIWNQPRSHAGRAFFELIHFADNEGLIGPRTSAKLAKDFAAHQAQAETFARGLAGDEGEWFLARYADWRRAFEMAAGEGAVSLH